MDHSQPGAGTAAPETTASAAPGYPPAAVEWAVGRRPVRILELVAGEGALTVALAALGHDVLATDPSEQLVSRLAKRLRTARTAVARAEDIPLPPAAVDVVVAGPRFASLDAARTLPEVARVLRPGGSLSLVWSRGDTKIPWVRKMFALTGTTSTALAPGPVESSELFAVTEHRMFRQWQRFERQTLVDFVASSEKAAGLPPDERASLLAEAGELYDGYGRGPDGLLMPWLVECYRARVKGATAPLPAVAAPVDDGLLIDFS
jgi:SAM-dependent methyltransferase